MPPGERSALRLRAFFLFTFLRVCGIKKSRASTGGASSAGLSPRVRGGSRDSPFIRQEFSFFSCWGGARHFGGGRLSRYRRRGVGLPASDLRIPIGNFSTFLPICSSPKCNICTMNYTLTITTGENILSIIIPRPLFQNLDRKNETASGRSFLFF